MGRTNLKGMKTTDFNIKNAEETITYGDLKLALKGQTIWSYSNLSKKWLPLYKDFGCTNISNIWQQFKNL